MYPGSGYGGFSGGTQQRVQLIVDVSANTQQAQAQMNQMATAANRVSTASQQATRHLGAAGVAANTVGRSHGFRQMADGMAARLDRTFGFVDEKGKQNEAGKMVSAIASGVIGLNMPGMIGNILSHNSAGMTQQERFLYPFRQIPLVGEGLANFSSALIDRVGAWQNGTSVSAINERLFSEKINDPKKANWFTFQQQIDESRVGRAGATSAYEASRKGIFGHARYRSIAESQSSNELIQNAIMGVGAAKKNRYIASDEFNAAESHGEQKRSDVSGSYDQLTIQMRKFNQAVRSGKNIDLVEQTQPTLHAIEKAQLAIQTAQKATNQEYEKSVKYAQSEYEVRMKEVQVLKQKVDFVKRGATSFATLDADKQYDLLKSTQIAAEQGRLGKFNDLPAELKQLMLSNPLTADWAKKFAEQQTSQSPYFQEILKMTGNTEMLDIAKNLPKMEAEVDVQVDFNEEKLTKVLLEALKKRDRDLEALIKRDTEAKNMKVEVEGRGRQAANSN